MVRPTASSLSRHLHCPGSATLPQVPTTGEHASFGRHVHRYLELVSLGQTAKAANELPPDVLAECESLDLDGLPPLDQLIPEAAYAYDSATHSGRLLAGVRNRGYDAADLGPAEVPGTADLVSCHGDTFRVWDYKMGTAESAYTNPQLRLLALAGCLHHQLDKAVGTLVYRRNDGWWYDSAAWDLLDLEEFGFTVADMFKRGRDDSFAEGSWCRYCPAYTSCPAKHALAQELAAGNLAAYQTRGLTRETYPAIRRSLAAAYDLLDRINKAAHMYATQEIEEHGPIDLGDNVVLDLVPQAIPEKLDGDVTYQVAMEMLSPELADGAIEKKATKKRLQEVARAAKKLAADAPTFATMLEEIRKRGGSKRGTTKRLKERSKSQ